MSTFHGFAVKFKRHFDMMSESELYRTNLTGDALWAAYLAAFPEGTDPIFRTRTERDCSCCKNFVRQIGGLVELVEGRMVSVWDVPDLEYPYNQVAKRLGDIVRSGHITGVFRTREKKFGAEKTFETSDSGQITWNHFFATVANRHWSNRPDEDAGQINTTQRVLYRGLTELTVEALDTVLELIESNNLYRGSEHLASTKAFKDLKLKATGSRHSFAWQHVNSSVARYRNTVIGTLVTDLSAGEDLEKAVKAFETKVAPTNYKRPTSLITKRMVDDAMKTINDLGLEPSLDRRFAQLSDVSVNNVLWVDAGAGAQMKGGIQGLLMDSVQENQAGPDMHVEIFAEEFFRDIVPKVGSMEAYFGNDLQKNLVSIIAPVHEDAEPIFKWPNKFSWSYNGNLTDSIKERVKAAGGNVEADLRVSLSWFNHDDLDLHAMCPDGHVYYMQKSGNSTYGRANVGRNILDVDMNAGVGTTRTPVENLSWIRPKNGRYKIVVHQYCQREVDNVGFTIEIAHSGGVRQYSYKGAVRGQVEVFSFDVAAGQVQNLKVIDGSITGQGISQRKWGIDTEKFCKVNTLMKSPNHWDDNRIGNLHWFFVLDRCENDEPARGIYNEFLRGDLEKHRKVFEVLGNKTKCSPTQGQLSGLGFSSTNHDTVIVRVSGNNFNRVYKVKF